MDENQALLESLQRIEWTIDRLYERVDVLENREAATTAENDQMRAASRDVRTISTDTLRESGE